MSNVVHAIIITALIFFALSILSVALIMAQWFFEDFLQIGSRIEKFLAIRRYEKEKREFFQQIAEENAKEMIIFKDKGAK